MKEEYKNFSVGRDGSQLLPGPIDRDLNIVFNKYPEYNQGNTFVISNFPNKNNKFIDNDIIVPFFHPVEGKTMATRDAHMYYLHEYLHLMIALFNKGHGKFFLIFYIKYLVTNIVEANKQVTYGKFTHLRTGNHNVEKINMRNRDDIRF